MDFYNPLDDKSLEELLNGIFGKKVLPLARFGCQCTECKYDELKLRRKEEREEDGVR